MIMIWKKINIEIKLSVENCKPKTYRYIIFNHSRYALLKSRLPSLGVDKAKDESKVCASKVTGKQTTMNIQY